MSFITCEKCGKKLLERLPNGLFIFKFGRRDNGIPVIDMQIHGSIRMKCIRRSCGHVNQLNYFPESQSLKGKTEL